MTSGFASASASAALITGANSRSAISTLVSAWSSMKAMIGGIEPGVDGVQHRARHRHAVMRLQHGGVLASITETVSPMPMPRAASAEASRRQRA